MGEVVAINGEEKETEEVAESADDRVVRWENFFPKRLRVLVVESDNPTRYLIIALLRKCNYRVAGVADGLKAWEFLKENPKTVDLVLTEIELPSISGFALLNLIAKRDVCKNIPVIMMAAHDSVNTVYNCMLRGAADFLVKPVTKNELKNLWRHVWRRRFSVKKGPQATSDAQQKVEVTAENDACFQKNLESVEKDIDAQSSSAKPDLEAEEANLESLGQSSCAKPDLEAEEANLGFLGQSSCAKLDLEVEEAIMGHKQDLTQQMQNKSQSDIGVQKLDRCIKESAQILMHDGAAYGLPAVPNTTDMTTLSRANVVGDDQLICAIVSSETLDKNNVRAEEALDLIGSFDKHPSRSSRSLGSIYGTNKVDSTSLLDLTLRRSHSSGSDNQVTDKRHKLNKGTYLPTIQEA